MKICVSDTGASYAKVTVAAMKSFIRVATGVQMWKEPTAMCGSYKIFFSVTDKEAK